jgi:lipopolysaccharide biosynthesis regulator YciM
MFKLTVEQILASIEALSTEEKQDLKAQLSRVLTTPEPEAESSGSTVQSQSISVGRDFQLQGQGNVADFSQTQTTGGNHISTPAVPEQDLQAITEAIADLKQAIARHPELNQVEKQTAAVPLNTLEEELQKPEPDKGLIDQAVAALKKGLDGVQVLAEPVMQVSSLVAKAWFLL